MVCLLAEDVKERIKEEVKDAKMHSVSADTTPDSASEDKMVVALRFVPPSGIPKERVIDMKECIDKRGEATAKDILSSLRENSIDVNALAFQTYDFTASMSGRIKGAQQCLQDILERSVP